MANTFTRKTPMKTILSQIKGKSACPKAVDWVKKHADLTWGEAADIMVQDTNFEQVWAAWVLAKIGEIADATIIKAHIDKITDPMMAFSLYLELSWLSDEEDKLLEAKFKGKLPTAESELAQGIVKRAKVT
jgi:hypothetical protein